MSKVRISIIIATYNSMRTLPKVIESVLEQDLNKDLFEVLIVDGGSKDGTIDFSIKKNLKIIENNKKDPVNAKYLGFKNSKGKYLMYLDHDEVISKKNFFSTIIKTFKGNEKIKIILPTGYENPNYSHFVNKYINEFGDPFSFFIYNISKNKDFFISSMKKISEISEEDNEKVAFKINHQKYIPLIELLAGGSCFDKEYVKLNFSKELTKPEFLPHLFYEITKKKPFVVILKNSPIVHYSSDNIKTYLNKLRWRIINNIFLTNNLGESGFSGRQKYHRSNLFVIKKYLFIPYSFSILLPLMDSFKLIITRKDLALLAHLPLTLYTSYKISTLLILKFFGFKPILKTYDGKDKIPSN